MSCVGMIPMSCDGVTSTPSPMGSCVKRHPEEMSVLRAKMVTALVVSICFVIGFCVLWVVFNCHDMDPCKYENKHQEVYFWPVRLGLRGGEALTR